MADTTDVAPVTTLTSPAIAETNGGRKAIQKLDASAVTQIPPRMDHPLQSSWTLWYSRKNPKEYNFESTLHQVGEFSTIEDYWRVFSRLRRPNELPKDTNLQLFRSSYRPLWENFPNGGMWGMHIKRHSPHLNRIWDELILALIGDFLDESDAIGVALHTRPKEDAFFIWHNDMSARFRIAYATGFLIGQYDNLFMCKILTRSEKLKQAIPLIADCPFEYRSNKFNMDRRISEANKIAANEHEQQHAKSEGD